MGIQRTSILRLTQGLASPGIILWNQTTSKCFLNHLEFKGDQDMVCLSFECMHDKTKLLLEIIICHHMAFFVDILVKAFKLTESLAST